MKKLSQEERSDELMLTKLALKRWNEELLIDIPLPNNYSLRVQQTLLQAGLSDIPSWVKRDIRNARNCNKNARHEKYAEQRIHELASDYPRAKFLFKQKIKGYDNKSIDEWQLYDMLKDSGVLTRNNGDTVPYNVVFRWIDQYDRAKGKAHTKNLSTFIKNNLSLDKSCGTIVEEIRNSDDFREYAEALSNKAIRQTIYRYREEFRQGVI